MARVTEILDKLYKARMTHLHIYENKYRKERLWGSQRRSILELSSSKTNRLDVKIMIISVTDICEFI